MSWIRKRKTKNGGARYRVLDRIDGKTITVVKNAGQWKETAMARKLEYDKQLAEKGTTLLPKKRLPIEDMCDLNLRLHGPNLKGGINDRYGSSYYQLKIDMGILKQAWKGKSADEISLLSVRDLLALCKMPGTKLRKLGVIGKMFRNFEQWQESGNVLPAAYQLPAKNPASQWRAQMKAIEKRELPDERVLTQEEWGRFSKHLSARARPICQLALQRCLRKSDIKNITHHSIQDGHIKGVQAKTGETFSVPVLSDQPTHYNFTNFAHDFEKAQIKADLFYPAEHPLHFSMKDLRRTGATWFYRLTKDLVKTKKLLGHRKLSTTERYLKITAVELQESVQPLDKMAEKSAAPVPHLPTSKAKGAH